MNEDAIRREVQRLLRDRGFVYLHIPRNSMVEGGQPDIWGVSGVGPSVACEVKTFEPRVRAHSFACRDLRDNQRAWLDWLYDACGLQCFLAIGTTIRPRKLWLIEWSAYFAFEKSLVEKEGHFNPHLRYTTDDLHAWLPNYELRWEAGCWVLPEMHPLQFTMAQCKYQLANGPALSLRFEQEVPGASSSLRADQRVALPGN